MQRGNTRPTSAGHCMIASTLAASSSAALCTTRRDRITGIGDSRTIHQNCSGLTQYCVEYARRWDIDALRARYGARAIAPIRVASDRRRELILDPARRTEQRPDGGDRSRATPRSARAGCGRTRRASPLVVMGALGGQAGYPRPLAHARRTIAHACLLPDAPGTIALTSMQTPQSPIRAFVPPPSPVDGRLLLGRAS